MYRCPAGQDLSYHGQRKDRDGRLYRHYQTRACEGCARRAQCTSAKAGRSLARYAGDELKEAMHWVLQQPRARAKYRERRTLGERVYAELSERQGLRRFHRRGAEGVRLEFALHCIAFDLKVALRHPAAACLRVRVFVVVGYHHLAARWVAVGVGSAAHTYWGAR